MRLLGVWEEEYFNSQPHEEADENKLEEMKANDYFNSQPHEEADHGETIKPPGKQYFNSQPHEEADEIHQNIVEC